MWHPPAVLVSRRTAELARLVAADAILGIGYAAEEVGDDDMVTVAPPTPPRPERARQARRKVEPVTDVELPEPDFDQTPVTATEDIADLEPELDEPGSDPITTAQSKLLHKLMRDRFGGDRDTSLTAISEQLRRPVETTKDPTIADASELIDWLSPEPEDDDE